MSPPHRDNLLRRLHALGASAKVLGFAAAAETLSRAEQQLRTGLADTLADDLVVVRGLLANLSPLVLRGSYSVRPGPTSTRPPASPSPVPQGPWCVVVCGSSLLAETLKSVGAASSGFELVQTQDVGRLRELCAMYGPDVVLLDATLDNAIHELQRLKEAPETAGVQFVVAHCEENAVETFKQAGAHAVLTANFSPIALWRATNRSRTEEPNLPSPREPMGDIGLRDLCDRLSRELKRGLFDAADEPSQTAVVSLGEGTEVRAAIWAAVARIREVLVTHSDGRIHFGPGPDGSVVLAPGAGLGLRGRTLADSASIDLTGRRILVADDDPAVAWFVGGTLRVAGADVREAQDGRRALAAIQQWWPELIVSDVLMPGMDGFALCREVKRDVALRDVPIILLSWKEDLLFRLRELGADADAYVRKEASGSALVDRVRELLWPRISLERRLRIGQEVRGRLEGITPRTLIEAACGLGRLVRITLRDASAHYDIRIRDHCLRAVTRTRANGVIARGDAALSALLGVSAGRFSVIEDDQPTDDDFTQSTLDEVLRTPILRARAAQRVLSGGALGTVERVSLAPDAFADELSMLPLSLRPLVDELLRGTSPSQLLAAGATSPNGLESLLSDAARRGAVLSITGKDGEDLLTREILALSAPSSELPPNVRQADPPIFTFQLTPSPLPVAPEIPAQPQQSMEPQALSAESSAKRETDDEFDWASEASWESTIPSGPETQVQAERSSPFSRPRISAEWGGSEKRKATEAIAAGLGQSLAATITSNAPAKLPSTPVTLRSPGEPAASPQGDLPPELARITASTAGDGIAQAIPAYQLRTAHLGLPIGLGPLEAKLPPLPAALASNEPEAQSPPPAPGDGPLNTPSKGAPLASDKPEAQSPPPAPGGGSPHTPSQDAPTAQVETGNADSPLLDSASAATTQEASRAAVPPGPTVPENEAVFPLYQSAAPALHTPHSLVTAAPVVQLGPAKDTLHSALAPTPIEPEPATQGSAEAQTSQPLFPTGTADAPAAATDESLTSESSQAAVSEGEHAAEAFEPAPPTRTDAVGTAAQGPVRSSAPPRRNQWLVPLSLALTAGVLSFTLALPIVQRFRARPAVSRVSAAAVTQPSIAVATPSAAPSDPTVSAPVATSAQALPVETNTELPPGITVAPDKGLLTLKTGGVHSIFVDDEFVGRGPERTVTLSAGPHRVRVALNGEEHTESIEVVAGRLVQRMLDTSGN